MNKHKHRLRFSRTTKSKKRLVFSCSRCGKELTFRRERVHMLCLGVSRFVIGDRTN
jgi:ssDNA-binding Zn-finger/Zn-ribbon topoisomerase 1